jgi:hypothetical protein
MSVREADDDADEHLTALEAFRGKRRIAWTDAHAEHAARDAHLRVLLDVSVGEVRFQDRVVNRRGNFGNSKLFHGEIITFPHLLIRHDFHSGMRALTGSTTVSDSAAS